MDNSSYDLEALLRKVKDGDLRKGIIAVVESRDSEKNQIVVLRRTKSRRYFPGWYTASVFGGIEPGETYEEAVLRELGEELGLKPEDILRKEMAGHVYDEVTSFLLWVFKVGLCVRANPRNACPEEIVSVDLYNKNAVFASAYHFANRLKLDPSIQSDLSKLVNDHQKQHCKEKDRIQLVGLTPSSMCALLLCYSDKNFIAVSYDRDLPSVRLNHFDHFENQI